MGVPFLFSLLKDGLDFPFVLDQAVLDGNTDLDAGETRLSMNKLASRNARSF